MDIGVTHIITAVAIVIALLMGTAIISGITSDERADTDLLVKLDGNKFTEINNGEGYDETVKDSRGLALQFTGADDSFVQSQDPITYSTDNTWTYATWARTQSGAETDDMVAVSWNGEVVIAYNATRTEWVGWYYNTTTRNSHKVNISAPNQPANLTHVALTSNGTHVTIYRNNTEGETVNITQAQTQPAPVEDSNWNGSLDETRTFDDALNASQRQALVDDGVGPLKDTNRTSRIMYDQPDRTQTVFFANTELDVSNVSWVSGLAGQVLTAGTDYEWDTDGPRIRSLPGGEVDGAPGVYVEYDFEGALSQVINAWSNAVGLAALMPLLIIVALILLRVRSV